MVEWTQLRWEHLFQWGPVQSNIRRVPREVVTGRSYPVKGFLIDTQTK